MQLVVTLIELDGRSPEPIQESTKNEEVTDATNHLPALGTLLEAAAFGTLLLLRNIGGEFRVELFVVFQERFALGIDGQRNGLLGLEEIHDGRRG